MFPQTGTKPEVVELKLDVPDSDVDQLTLELLDLVEQNRRVRRLSLLSGLHEGCG
jgi:hypothetical protein